MLENSQQSDDSKALLVADNVGFKVRGKVILTDVSLQLEKKEIITLIGPNGAGKTSLVRILLGLSHASSGRVVRKSKLRVGYVPQRIQVPEVMPLRVYDFLNVMGKYDVAQCQHMLDEVNCEFLLYSPMQGISGGEMQRVLLARALLKNQNYWYWMNQPPAWMSLASKHYMRPSEEFVINMIAAY